MGTVTDFVTGKQEVKDLGTGICVTQNLLDFTKKAGASSDVVQALKIPAGALVLDVWCIVRTAQGATCTATVGDGDGANSWDASTNLNATAGTVTSSLKGTDAYAVGKYYSAADTIDLVLGHTANAAKIVVCAKYAMIEV